jgi:asparagine synthase (glutamine-hydrolysing)
MCGIYGMVALGGAPLGAPDALGRMGRTLRHRGPDDRGAAATDRAAFGVERLRITDPSARAAQPFVDAGSGVWLAANGAIYNGAVLRRRYRSYPYRSRSDTEPILPLYLERGAGGLAELDGMFAVAIWDGHAGRLVLARDRAGEKPLFYARIDDELWFASEVQALLEHPSLRRSIDASALRQYLTLGYVLEPRTPFAAIRRVEAGTVAVISADGTDVTRYWQPESVGIEYRPLAEAERALDRVLEDAVAKQLQADVPIGVFTSGGVDSALLTALAVRSGAAPDVHTFTVGFGEPSYDERAPAARVAGHFGTRHTAVTADEAALGEAFETITARVAEPISDPAVLPTYLLARAARQHVGVVLGGEGADELFGGYPTYVGHQLAPRFAALPRALREAAARLAAALPTSHDKVPLEFLLKRFLAAAELPVMERHLKWFGTGLDPAVWGAEGPLAAVLPNGNDGGASTTSTETGDALRRVMLFDYRSYLRDNLLVKIDRATMLVSLEARAPYLDRDVTRFALGLETRYKVRGLGTKWLFKRVARRQLPAAIVHRRKRGLSVPVGHWINGGLRGEVDRLLSQERLRAEGLLQAERVGQLLSEHRDGSANHARALWPLIVWEAWRERWLGD